MVSVNLKAEPDKLSIQWLQTDAAPFHLEKNNQFPYGGICDTLQAALITAMPEVNHSTLVLPQTRIAKALDGGNNVCFPCMIHRDSDTSRAFYSHKTVKYPQFALIALPGTTKTIQKFHGNPVELSTLLADPKFILGQHGSRKLSNVLEKITSESEQKKAVAKNFRSKQETKAVIDMMLHGYVDYTLDYPFVASYFNHMQNLTLQTSPLVNQMGQAVYGAVGCSASAPDHFAEKALNAINKALESQVFKNQVYLRSLDFWQLDLPLKNSATNGKKARRGTETASVKSELTIK